MVKKEIFDRITKQISEMSAVELQQFIQKINSLWQLEAGENSTEEAEENQEYNKLIEELSSLNLKEFNSLVRHMEETLGIKASVSAGAGAQEEEGEKKEQEKSHYQVSIVNFKQESSQRIKFIQLLRTQQTSLDLPSALKVFATIEKGENYILSEKATKDDAMAMKNALEAYVDVILK